MPQSLKPRLVMPPRSICSRISIPCVVRQVVILACAFSLLWLANIVNTPSTMHARSMGYSAHARTVMQREVLDKIARLIGQSIEVLAVHDRADTSYAEIVLWQRDDVNPGVIDIDELAVISHSRLFRTVTLYTAAGDQKSEVRGQNSEGGVEASPSHSLTSSPAHLPRPGAAAGRTALSGDGLRLPMASVGANMMLDRTAASDAGFCDRWRASPQVLPRVLGTDLSDLLAEPAGPSGSELSALQLTLTWASDSSDGAQDMSVLVKLRAPRGQSRDRR